MTNPLTGNSRSPEAPTCGAFARAKTIVVPLLRSLFLIPLVVASAAMATDSLPAPVLDPEGIRFPLVEESGRLALTVSGPEDFHVRREFAGVAPALSLVGPEGDLPVDGTYVWELRSLEGARPAIGSGAFHVVSGRPLTPSGAGTEEALAKEPPAPLPVTHAENVYIIGRLCVGDACTDVTPLPLEAIRMKQNNPWIRVEDTSDGMTFPTRDWQLKFNDSTSFTNGGTNYFAVEDRGDDGTATNLPLRVDAGAPTHSIRVTQLGRVGLGTATPGATLHVAGEAIVDGDFTAGSSREIKHAFEPIEPRAILERLVELPVTEWSYRTGDAAARHMGPVSEDFVAAFGLGRDDRHVSPVDLSGVAFAAIQGLHALVRERDAEIEELRRSRDALEARLAAIESRLE